MSPIHFSPAGVCGSTLSVWYINELLLTTSLLFSLFRYIIDYVLICGFIVFFSSLDKMEPFHQKFSLNNWTIQYPFAEHERVPVWMAGVISCAFPLLVIILYALVIDGAKKVKKGNGLYAIHPMRERLWEMNCGILGLGLSVAAVIFFTGALKNAIGKPRPDMLARCQPPKDAVDPLPFGLSDYSICTGDKHILKDGFKSFPSGHSSSEYRLFPIPDCMESILN